jgi:hypothetical protein
MWDLHGRRFKKRRDRIACADRMGKRPESQRGPQANFISMLLDDDAWPLS